MDGAAPGPGLQDRAPAPDLHGPDEDRLRPDRQAVAATPREGRRQTPDHWVDGHLVSAADRDPASALLDVQGCYTTARVCAGSALHAARHARRLRRDAQALGLEPPEAESVLAAFGALAEAVFGAGSGIVRLDLGRGPDGRCHLVGRTRPLGPEPALWSAIVAPLVHPGPTRAAGAKRSHVALYARARQLACEAASDEALLFDSQHRLVEGARSNLFVVDRSGRLLAPGPARGAVAGVAREILCERLDAASEADIDEAGLAGAREVVAVNAVRGARPLVHIDGAPVGDGAPGPWATRLAAILLEEAGPPTQPAARNAR